MSVPLSRRWAEALRLVLKRVYDPTTRVPVPWYLSGETSLNLQGVSIEPDLIEFRAISPFAAAYFAQLMRPYEAPDTAATIVYRLGGNMAPSESWRCYRQRSCHTARIPSPRDQGVSTNGFASFRFPDRSLTQ